MTAGILAGMRVVEASAFVAAPSGGMTLAQMGADVIRIDLPSGGLDYRRWPVTDAGTSLFWCGLNKGKRSVCIDFSKPEGSELAMELIGAPGADAGMLLTNFPPSGWLSFESLQARRSDLIQLTVQGNHHGDAAVDYTVNASMGLPYLTGPSDRGDPVNHVLPAWDLVTGQMAAIGLLAAIDGLPDRVSTSSWRWRMSPWRPWVIWGLSARHNWVSRASVLVTFCSARLALTF
jgi:2-methylfumaryl-CoA isomerase